MAEPSQYPKDSRDGLDIEAKAAEWRTAYAARERTWATNLSYYNGVPYRTFNRSTGRFFSAASAPEKIRFMSNQVLSAILYQESVLRQSTPTPYVRRATNEQRDEDAAVCGDAYLDYFRRVTNNQQIARELRLYLMLYGCGYKKFWWDTSALGVVSVDDKTGAQKTAEVGDVKQYVGSPFDLKIDPSAKSFDKARWIIEETFRSSQEVEDMYGATVEEESMPMNASYWVASDNPQPFVLRKGVAIREYWERPCKKYPNGRYAVSANGVLLPVAEKDKDGNEPADPFITDLPYFEATGGEVVFPFVWYVLVPNLINPYGMSVTEHIIQHNMVLNRITSQQIQNMDTQGAMKMKVPIGTSAFELDNSVTVQKIDYNAQVGNGPEWLNPPQLKNSELRAEILADMKEITGTMSVPELAQADVSTARGQISQLQLNQSRTALVADQVIEKDPEFYGGVLKLAKVFKTEDEMLPIVGEEDELSLYAFKGANIGTTDVSIVDGTGEVHDPWAVEQVVERWGQYKIVDPAVLQEILLELKLVPNIPKSPHVKKSERENRDLRRGMSQLVAKIDDDSIHIRHHENWLATHWFQPWMTDKIRSITYQHIMAHAYADKGDDSMFDPVTGIQTEGWRPPDLGVQEPIPTSGLPPAEGQPPIDVGGVPIAPPTTDEQQKDEFAAAFNLTPPQLV